MVKKYLKKKISSLNTGENLNPEKKGILEKTLIFFIGIYSFLFVFKNFISDKYGTILLFVISVTILILLFTIWVKGIIKNRKSINIKEHK